MTGLSATSWVLLQLAALALLAGGAYAWGCWVVRLRFFGGADELAWRGAGGLVVLSTAAFVLAALHLLTPISAGALLVVPWLHPRPWRAARGLLGRVRASPAWWRQGLLAGVAIAPVLLWALYPPTVFDSTLYHLPIARSFVDGHGLASLETVRFSVLPAFSHLLFALMLPLVGDTAGNLVQFTQMILTALGLYATGRRYLSPAVGWLAVALWVGSPLVVWEAGAAMVDLGVALFVVMALAAWERVRAGQGGVLLWMGIFGGAAAATKYTGLIALAVLALGFLAERRPWRSVATVLLGAALAAGPHYARLFALTGDPVYPVLTALRGHRDFPRAAPVGGPFDPIAWGHSPSLGQRMVRGARALAFPYEVFFLRDRWHRQPPISPAFLPLLPVALGSLRRRGIARRWLVIALVQLFVVGFWQPPFAHYMIPLLATMCLPAAAAGELAWNALRRRALPPFEARRPAVLRRAVAVGVACVALLGPFYAARQAARRGVLPATGSQRDRFLGERVRGYAALAWLNQTYGDAYGVYGLHLESSRYFSAGRFLGDWSSPWSYARFRQNAHSGAALAAFLRRAGADFLLVAPEGLPELPRDATFSAWFELVRRDGDGTMLYRLAPPPDRP